VFRAAQESQFPVVAVVVTVVTVAVARPRVWSPRGATCELSNHTQSRSRRPALPLTPRVEHHPEVLQPAAQAPVGAHGQRALSLRSMAPVPPQGARGHSHIDPERRCCGRRRGRLAVLPPQAHRSGDLRMWCDRHGQPPASRPLTITAICPSDDALSAWAAPGVPRHGRRARPGGHPREGQISWPAADAELAFDCSPAMLHPTWVGLVALRGPFGRATNRFRRE
jgi:hypothetical protein